MDLSQLNLFDLLKLRQQKYRFVASHVHDIDLYIKHPSKDVDPINFINFYDILLRDIDNIDFQIKNKILVDLKWQKINRDNYQKLLQLLLDNFSESLPISNPQFFFINE